MKKDARKPRARLEKEAAALRKQLAALRRSVTERKRTEEMLLLRAQVLDNMSEGVSFSDEHGVIRYTNPAEDAMFGYEQGELIGEHVTVLNAYPPEENARIVGAVIEQLRTNGAWQGEFWNRKKDGATFYTAAHISALEISGRKHWICVQADITERKRTESLLVTEKSILGMLLTEASLTAILDALCRMIEEQAEGMKCSVLLLDADGVHMRYVAAPTLPASYVRDLDGFAIGPTVGSCGTAAYCGKQVIVSDISTDPLWDGCRDVGLRNGIRACWSTPIFSAGGKVVGTFAMFYAEPRGPGEYEMRLIEQVTHIATVVIERKRAEATLRQSEERHRALYDDNPSMYFTVNADGIVLSVNRFGTEQLGYRLDELMGQPVLAVFHEEDRQKAAGYLRAAFQAPAQVHQWELRKVRKDGCVLWVREDVRIIQDSAGAPLALVVCEDITGRKRTEELLARSRDFYLSILQEFPAMVWRSGLDAKCDYFNNTWLFFTGRTLEQELGDGWAEGVHPDDVEPCVARYLKAFHAREPFVMEYRLRRHDGEYRFIFDHGTPFTDLDGHFAGFIGACYDITERKLAEEALRESEAFKNRILENSPDCIKVLDLEGRLLFMSKGGMERLEIDDATAFLNSLWVKFWQGEDEQKARAAIDAARVGGVGRFIGFYPTATGKPKWWDVFVIPLLDASGKPEKLLSISRDITERKRAEEALRESEERFALAVRGSSDGLWDGHPLPDQPWHSPQTPIWWSPRVREMLGFEEQEFPNILESWAGLLHPEEKDCVFAALAAHIERRVPYDAEYRLRTKQGDYRWFRARGQAIWGEAGKVQRMAGSLQDITEHKQLEEQLRQAQKMEAVGTLAGGIAHDFNNILTPILSCTDLVFRTLPEDNPSRPDLEQVLIAARRAKNLVKQLLAFSRWDPGYRSPVSLGGLIKETLLFLRASIPTTIEIRPRLVALRDLVLADATQVQQVLLNLCSNAEQAMRQTGGVLEVILENCAVDEAFAARHAPLQSGPHVRLTVRDSGCGMASEVLLRIFDPFFTTKGPGEGTGLGLSMVHGIVTSHGGAITVSSVPGQGTTVEVYLPAITAKAESERPSQAIVGGAERILFVDDEAAVLRSGERLLRMLGYTVTAMDDSRQALEAFRAATGQFDLVITDQTMPGLTGGALAAELLRIRPDLPIILCTGFSHTMTAEQAAALGIRAFVTKPYAVESMAATIRRALDRRAEDETTRSV